MRKLWRPRWVGGHLLVLAACVAFAFLGRWQWDKSHGPGGTGQNFIYAIQWWLFILGLLYWWAKVLHDEVHPPPPKYPVRQPLMPPPAATDEAPVDGMAVAGGPAPVEEVPSSGAVADAPPAAG